MAKSDWQSLKAFQTLFLTWNFYHRIIYPNIAGNFFFARYRNGSFGEC